MSRNIGDAIHLNNNEKQNEANNISSKKKTWHIHMDCKQDAKSRLIATITSVSNKTNDEWDLLQHVWDFSLTIFDVKYILAINSMKEEKTATATTTWSKNIEYN